MKVMIQRRLLSKNIRCLYITGFKDKKTRRLYCIDICIYSDKSGTISSYRHGDVNIKAINNLEKMTKNSKSEVKALIKRAAKFGITAY